MQNGGVTRMKNLFHWMLRLTTAAIVLATIAVIFAFYLAWRSLPQYDKTLQVTGITEHVEIVRDTANVPHIFGANDADVFFGLGYAHAQDRLWQMTILRRTVQGRLSEIFGPRTLNTDILLRSLDLDGLAKSSLAAQTPDTLAALTAYAQGINARIAEINATALGRGAPEMFVFDVPFAPWQPADSIAIQKLMALQLSGQAARDILYAKTSLTLPFPDRIDDIFPAFPGAPILDLPEYSDIVPIKDDQHFANMIENNASNGFDILSPITDYALAGASNAFAAAPARSAAGGSLLANDPHLGLTAPGVFYLARLELATGGVIGGTIPGLPFVLVGRNHDLAWGMTTSYLDDQDIVMEEINPTRPSEYRTQTGWAQIETTPSIIQVKGQAPVTIDIRKTKNGPVLPKTFHQIDQITPPNHLPVLQWTALRGDDPSLSSGLALMRARTVEQGIAAFDTYQAPSQNLTFADATSIAMKTVGIMPIRDQNHTSQGKMPSLGWMRENQWQGYKPYGDTPQTINPAGGILGNTNNKIADGDFPDHMSFYWGDSQRIRRWERLMQNRQVHTRESFIETQLDTVSFAARGLLPLIGAELWFTGAPAPAGTLDRSRQEALQLLASWNGEMNEHLPEPLIYMAWMRALQNRLIRDDVGPLAGQFRHVDPLFIEKVYRNIDDAGDWCDVVQSTVVETCVDMARLALDDALVWLAENFDRDPKALRWGDAHQATHDHPTLGAVPVLNYFVNIRQSTSGGDNTLMRGKTGGRDPNPFLNVHAAAYRGVYDFADPDSSVFIISTGQSGHFLSRHYDDMGHLWRRGEYVQMSLDPALARAAATGITTLQPASGISDN